MKSTMPTSLLLLAALLLLTITSLHGQSTLRGTIRKLEINTGEPLQGAKISVDDSYTATADESGAYTINGIPTGSHNINVVHVGSIGMNQVNYTIDGATRFNVSLPDSMQTVPLGTGPIILDEFKEMYATTGDDPNFISWDSLPIDTFLSNAAAKDSALFQSALGTGTGNWQTSLPGSVENLMERPLWILTSDSVAACDHGIIIQFNNTVDSTNAAPRDENPQFIRRAICNVTPIATKAILQKEASGRAFYKQDVASYVSNMNSNPSVWTLKDNIYTWVAENHFSARQRGEQDADLMGFSYNSPLPIQLVSFVARFQNGKDAELKWRTLSEIKNSGFEIQRSSDNTHYMSVPGVFIPGHGTTTSPHNYSYVDTPADPDDYYRLKQVDVDGSVHFSEAVRCSASRRLRHSFRH